MRAGTHRGHILEVGEAMKVTEVPVDCDEAIQGGGIMSPHTCHQVIPQLEDLGAQSFSGVRGLQQGAGRGEGKRKEGGRVKRDAIPFSPMSHSNGVMGNRCLS